MERISDKSRAEFYNSMIEKYEKRNVLCKKAKSILF